MIDKIYNRVISYVNNLALIKYNIQKCHFREELIEYVALPCSYDIETTSFRIGEDRLATAYAMIINIDSNMYIARTWEEVEYIFGRLPNIFKLGENRHLIIYVHNLPFDFQFTAPHLNIQQVFATDTHEPLYAIANGIEFRCSYKLSGKSLENLAKDEKLSVKKLVGDLDYEKMRHSYTPITEKEKDYIINDSEVIIQYIKKLMKSYKIGDIPLTKTAFVRRFMRKKVFESKEDVKSIRRMTLSTLDYLVCKKAFMGGFTHAAIFNSDKVLRDVHSYDFTSSYPAVMVLEKFPSSSPLRYKEPSEKILEYYLNNDNYCSIVEVEFTNLRSKNYMEFPIPFHKAKCVHDRVFNGRVMEAEELTITCTDMDLLIYKEMYDYDTLTIKDMYIFRKDYLPKSIIMGVLELYKDKTELKGIKEKEEQYAYSKELLNSCFGMCVTDIVKPIWKFPNNHWECDEENPDVAIQKYNNSKTRFLYYPWGVWITAYARYNLFTAIKECGYDYVYADTDSVKIFNAEKHKQYFDDYNRNILRKIDIVSKYYGIPKEMFSPKTIKGKEKTIGLWDYEGMYNYFKTEGAKRYMWIKDGVVNVTVAGLKKTTAVPYLLDKFNIPYVQNIYTKECIVNDYKERDFSKLFNYFHENFTVPEDYSGRTTHLYVDGGFEAYLTDYLGDRQKVTELAYINIEKASYTINRMDEFLRSIVYVKERDSV